MNYIIDIYTEQGVISLTVKATTRNYQADITAALESGNTLTLTTTEDSVVIINPIHAAAIEIKEADTIPPV